MDGILNMHMSNEGRDVIICRKAFRMVFLGEKAFRVYFSLPNENHAKMT